MFGKKIKKEKAVSPGQLDSQCASPSAISGEMHDGATATTAESTNLPHPRPPAPVAPRPGTPLPAKQKPEQKDSLLSRMFFKDNVSEVDLQFMSEVDAAIHRRGMPRAYILSLGVFGFFIVFLIWASFTRLDEVTRAVGQVESAQAVQEIQNREGGTLEELRVHEGDTVKQGDIVARVSNVMAASQLQEQQGAQALLQAEVIRLKAEQDGEEEPVFPEELQEKYPGIVAGQLSLFKTHKQQYDSEIRALEAQKEQRLREVEGAEARQKSISANLEIAIQQRDTVNPLMVKGIYPRVDYMRLEQSVVSLRGDLESVAQSIFQSRSAVEEAVQKISSRKSEWYNTTQEELNKKNGDLTAITTRLKASGEMVKRTDVTSPVNGKIKTINAKTIGMTIQPGATIMEILPVDDKLVITARVRPTDRAFIHTADDPAQQQKAVIKIGAYDFSIYGGLDARLTYISDDTLEDKKKGDVYYEVKLVTDKNYITYHGEQLPIMPGMTATADIMTGKKTVLSYLLKPILKAKQNALTER